jgi:hypothetical protein
LLPSAIVLLVETTALRLNDVDGSHHAYFSDSALLAAGVRR